MIFAGKNYLLLAVLAAVVFLNCKDDIMQSEITANINQVGKCNSQGLNKSASECFEYSFTNDLLIKFCVSGNCCPDSARFVTSYKISGEVITISIKDIAPNLCKCICNYTIQANLLNVNLDSYTIVCLQETIEGTKELYNKKITRQNR